MAQAARLNLRMQRELKLLLSDPPHGAAFPSLSSSSSAPSLSSIDAEIEGPEGTVYANGIFKLKIRIPDRYPFQPPVVTLVTPIYHPNIDNGGRICLDILNLPPKGAWQPSLNLSTVLTSIGLLLSEPNPDDGLMHDASEEYKYNRQAFYQKARSMTEKFAMAKASEDVGSVPVQQIQTRINNPDIEKVDDKGSNASKSNAIQCFLSQNRSCGVSRKLSLDSSGSKHHRFSTGGVNGSPVNHLSDNQLETGDLKHEDATKNQNGAGELKHNRDISGEFNAIPRPYLPDNQIEAQCLNKKSSENKKLLGIKVNMSPELSGLSVTKSSDKKDDLMRDPFISHLEAQSGSTKHKKLGLAGRKMSLVSFRSSQSLQSNKGNLVSSENFANSKGNLHSRPSLETGDFDEHARKSSEKVVHEKLERTPLQPVVLHQESEIRHFQLDRKQEHQEKLETKIKEQEIELPLPEAVIVLDSEDSEDERNLPTMFKSSLARKCLPGKRKAKA